jgi:hypothetical protein
LVEGRRYISISGSLTELSHRERRSITAVSKACRPTVAGSSADEAGLGCLCRPVYSDELGAFVALALHRPIGLSVQQGVQRLLHAATHDEVDVVRDRSRSIVMTLVRGLGVLSDMRPTLRLSWLHLATSSFSQIWGQR